MERQLDIFSFIDEQAINHEKHLTDIGKHVDEVDKEIKAWLVSGTIRDWELPLIKMIHTIYFSGTGAYLGYKDCSAKQVIKQLETMARSKILHYYTMTDGDNDEIYSVETLDGDRRYLVFRIGNMILFSTFPYDDPLKVKVRFPTSCIEMFDANGNSINFNNREDFIMNKLGYKSIGQINKTFTERMFCTVEANVYEICNYLKRDNS